MVSLSNPYIIIGTSAACIGAISKLMQMQPNARIIGISQEMEKPYNKCLLADYAVGTKGLDDLATTRRFANQSNIQFLLGQRVTRIMPEHCTIELADSTILPYQKLLLATGSSPYIPDVFKHMKSNNLFFFHTLADVNHILNYTQKNAVTRAVIIGAGLSGLECADALQRRGITATIIEQQAHVLPAFLSESDAQIVHQAMQGLGIDFLSATVAQCLYDNKGIYQLRTSADQRIYCDLVILATGSRPNSDIAQSAGIECWKSSVKVTDTLQTSHANIYAAGDLVVVKNQLTGQLCVSSTWPDAMMQGGYAACAMAGMPKPYQGIIPMVSSAFFGLAIAIGGQMEHECKISQKMVGSDYISLAINQNNRLRGFIFMGKTLQWTPLRRALMTQEDISSIQDIHVYLN